MIRAASKTLLQAYKAKLMEIGDALGYETRRSYKKSAAGDTVWLDRRGERIGTESLTVVAFKLLTFETAKEIREAIGLTFRVSVWTDEEVLGLYAKEVEARLKFV